MFLPIDQNQRRNGRRIATDERAEDGAHAAPCRRPRGWKSARTIPPIPFISVRLSVKSEDT